MLHELRPLRRLSRSSVFSHAPNRTTRWLGLALLLCTVLFTLRLSHINPLPTVFSSRRQPPPLPPPPWQKFEFLKRYYGGIRSVRPSPAARPPEFPHGDEHPQIEVALNWTNMKSTPVPDIDDPYPDYSSKTYQDQFGSVQKCYLDSKDTVPVPRTYVYKGVMQGFPEPIMGSHEVTGIPGNVCYDRYGRLGPYGYGYSKSQGGVGAGIYGERHGAEPIWATHGHVDYRKLDWSAAQDRCYKKNKHRFNPILVEPEERWRNMELTHGPWSGEGVHPSKPLARTALVIRVWDRFLWTQEATLHMRAVISELALLSGGEYQIIFLVEFKDDPRPIWASEEIYSRVLREALPDEFTGMGVLWSQQQMELIYEGVTDTMFMGRPVHGVYRSAHFPLQYLSYQHPEFEYFWNWEIDIRYTGHWYELFESLRSFARQQPRKGLWERNERFYVPHVHGSWEDFTNMARNQSEMPIKVAEDETIVEPPVWGPKAPADVTPFLEDPIPPHSHAEDHYEWGVGEEADLITLNPLFNPNNTGWVFSDDTTGFDIEKGQPPRRTSIITASRLSRRLLKAMHMETSLYRHTMFDEMWPATVALHHGYKAVYAPHPVYVDRAWPPSYLAKTLNSGLNGASGTAWESPFNIINEHNFRGVTWYFNAGFPSNLWRRWLGFRVDNSGGTEDELLGEGRMCLPPMLLHPIKEVEFEFGD